MELFVSHHIEPRTKNQEPRTKNQEPRTKNQEPRTKNQEPRTKNQEPRTKNQEPRTKNIMKQHCFLSSIFSGIYFFVVLLGCKQEEKVWKIGFIGPMSGQFANFGLFSSQAVQLAIREFHDEYDQIGGRKIQLVIKDSQFQNEIAAIAARELIEKEDIIGLIGPMASSSALAVAENFQRARIPLISGSATNPTLTSVGDYIFRTIASDNLLADVLSHYLAQERQMPSLAILYTAEDAFSEALAQSVAGNYEKLGGKVLINALGSETEFLPYLEEPEAIFLPLQNKEFSSVLAQLRENPRYQSTLIIGSDAVINPQFFELAGNMAEGIIVAASPQHTSYEAQYFEALYQVSFGMKPDLFAQYYYDSTIILLDAMRRTYQIRRKMDATTLKDEITKTIYTGVTAQLSLMQTVTPKDILPLKKFGMAALRRFKHTSLKMAGS